MCVNSAYMGLKFYKHTMGTFQTVLRLKFKKLFHKVVRGVAMAEFNICVSFKDNNTIYNNVTGSINFV